MKTPNVSIYITNYNYELFIEQSIQSVLNQTLTNFELLIIDDGSTDGSKNIIEKYRDHPKISIIYQQNKGLNITNNVAMRAARGKYLMRLDADDYLVPEALEKMYEILESNEQLGLVFPDYFYVDAEGKITGEERRHNFNEDVSLYDLPAHGACTMIRLEFLKVLGGYNESFTCQDGYDLWIKFISHHKVTNINEPLFYYRRHGNNLTNNEHKILNTRKQIKEAFVSKNLKIPNTIAIIPVRDTFIGSENWPMFKHQEKTIVELKIEECLKSDKLKHIIVSVAGESIGKHLENKYLNEPRLHIIERAKALAELNISLNQTVRSAIEFLTDKNFETEAVMTVSLEFPLLSYDVIDEMINTLVIFKSDAVLSVRPDNRSYYQHTGHSLKPILDQDKYTRLEREALYRGAGGIVLSTLKNFRKNGKLLSGQVSHVVVDEQCAFEVNSKLNLDIFEILLKINLFK